MKMRTRGWAAVLAMACGAFMSPGGGQLQAAEEGWTRGARFPDLEFSSAAREVMRISDFRGRPLLVNFWASWCGPCRDEFPRLEALHERYGDRVAFVVLNLWEDYAKGVAWAAEKRSRHKLQLYDSAFERKGKQTWLPVVGGGKVKSAVRGIPDTYLLDADGVVRKVWRTRINRQFAGQAIRRLLRERDGT